MDGTRIDKWLWAARFFKTRELASKACEMGRVSSNRVRAKPAREVRVGDRLHVRNEAAEFEVEVLAVSQQRGPAAVAQTLYRETEASVELAPQGGRGAAADGASPHRRAVGAAKQEGPAADPQL
jgi:ribosome-associated heat shock protein Hsp15